MSIISFQFLIFCVLSIAIYFLLPKKWQWIVLLLANVAFYAFSGAFALIYVFVTALATYIAARLIEKTALAGKDALAAAQTSEEKTAIKARLLQKKKLLCGAAIGVGIGIWIVLKYGDFLLQNINALLRVFGFKSKFGALAWMIPLGISYYTFHAVGYLVDVYRGKYAAERNFAKYFTFISFFPHILQGPFSRYDQLQTTLFAQHDFSYDRLCEGSRRVLWGVFKKLLVADKFGIAVVTILSGYQEYAGVQILVAMIFYGIQIYADFSGYMDIMCGTSHIMGIKLAENFQQPYFAKSVDEFWRRWHITLGKWFKDYVFYPVSMGKAAQKMGKWARKKFGAKMGKLLPGYFALIFVWSATGLWHGANWTYLVWGYLNLIIIMFSMQMGDTYEKAKTKLHINSQSWWWQGFGIVRTFLIVCFLRFFSIADSVPAAISTLQHAFSSMQLGVLANPRALFVGMTSRDIFVGVLGCTMMFVVDVLNEKNRWEDVKARTPMVVRNIVYAVLIFAIILFAGGNNDLVGGFLYAEF